MHRNRSRQLKSRVHMNFHIMSEFSVWADVFMYQIDSFK